MRLSMCPMLNNINDLVLIMKMPTLMYKKYTRKFGLLNNNSIMVFATVLCLPLAFEVWTVVAFLHCMNLYYCTCSIVWRQLLFEWLSLIVVGMISLIGSWFVKDSSVILLLTGRSRWCAKVDIWYDSQTSCQSKSDPRRFRQLCCYQWLFARRMHCFTHWPTSYLWPADIHS